MDEKKYGSIHKWLRYHYGPAKNQKCQLCNKEAHDWALIKGKEYDWDRKSFMPLCRRCHNNYDGKPTPPPQPGPYNPMSKLSVKQVHQIRERIKQGESNVNIAKDFPVKHDTISLIRHNKRYANF